VLSRALTYCTALVATLTVSAAAQEAHLPSRQVTVPFDDAFGLIWVPTVVQATDTLWFLLDTGFEFSLIDAATATSLHLQLTDVQTVPQPGGAVDVGTVSGTRIDIGPAEFTDWPLQALPLAALQPIVGRSFGGIVGHDMIAAFVTTIDYDRRVLTFTDPEEFSPPPDAVEIPLTILNNEPFVDAAIVQPHRSRIPGRFKLDTGSLDALGLNRNFLENQEVLAPDQATRSIPGVAVGGETDGILFEIDGFSLGPFLVEGLVIGATLESGGFEDRADAGTIGAEILRRLTITLDYPNSRMFLERNGQFADPAAVNRSGMWVIADGDDFSIFRVRFVLEGAAADAAGIAAGDRITRINGEAASAYTLVDLWRILRGEPGSTVDLTVERDGSTRQARLVLRSPI
jgi:hypothetical protein